MRKPSGSDQLAASFTDLMASLMVIFILLLLVFVNNQASANSVTAQALMTELRTQLIPAGFKREDIRIDANDPSTILLAFPNSQLLFQPNSLQLEAEGDRFIQSQMPRLTATLCAEKFRDAIDSVIIEGHSDSTAWRGVTPEESQSLNLKLSQGRSMEVVERMLASLSEQPNLRACLLEKISATGRGEQDLAVTADQSRRVVIKVRVNSAHAAALANDLAADPSPALTRTPMITPTISHILDLLSKLNTVPRQPVVLHLSDAEVNEYLTYALLISPRPGIDSVSIKFFPHNYISTVIIIDFDLLEKWSHGLIAGLPGLAGKKALWIDLRFSLNAGTLSWTVEKAYYANKRLPEFLAEKILETIGAHQRENASGLEMAVPFGMRHIQTGEHFIEGEK